MHKQSTVQIRLIQSTARICNKMRDIAMTPQPDLAGLEPLELEEVLESRGIERFHARQLYRRIYKRGVTDFERMTDLSKALRSRLREDFTLTTPRIVSDEQSTVGAR